MRTLDRTGIKLAYFVIWPAFRAIRMFSHVDPIPGVAVQGACSTFPAVGGLASDKGSDQVASNEYVNLDRRQSSSAKQQGIDADPGPP